MPGAEKISRAWANGADLQWRDMPVEVKRRAEGFRFDYRNLEDVHMLLKRADREDWLVTMRLDTLLDMLDE